MKKNISAAAMLEMLMPPNVELEGGVQSFYHEDIFAEARKGGRLAGQVVELVQACYSDEMHCKLAQFHFSSFAKLMTEQGRALTVDPSDVKKAKRCVDAMNMNIMAERLAYKGFYAKLETSLRKLEEVRTGVTFTFNGRSTRMDKDGKKKETIIGILTQHTRNMAETMVQYKASIEDLTVEHDNLQAICALRTAKTPSLPKAFKR